jgi:CRP-like cAMP-binding protein
MPATLANHPQRVVLRQQLRQNLILGHLTEGEWRELEPLLELAESRKASLLVHQGSHEMEQFFVLEGVLKRVVASAEGKEMILRFAAETDIETSYAAWRLKTPVPYSIVAVTRVRVAKLAMPVWVHFLDRHPRVKAMFEYEVMRLMSDVMAHSITLHLLDAPGRLARFLRKHEAMAGRLPNKELAAFLNLTPETLSRLKARGLAADG